MRNPRRSFGAGLFVPHFRQLECQTSKTTDYGCKFIICIYIYTYNYITYINTVYYMYFYNLYIFIYHPPLLVDMSLSELKTHGSRPHFPKNCHIVWFIHFSTQPVNIPMIAAALTCGKPTDTCFLIPNLVSKNCPTFWPLDVLGW